MDFHTYTTMRDWTRRADPQDRTAQDIDRFYARTSKDAVGMGSAQFFAQMLNERDWEKARRPFYNVWPSIIPMLTKLNLDLDSNLIQLPLPALCIRFPKEKNPLAFEWKGTEMPVRCIMMGEINEGTGLSVLVDIGEVITGVGVPVYTYRNFPRRPGLTVEQSLAGLGTKGLFAEIGVQVPDALVKHMGSRAVVIVCRSAKAAPERFGITDGEAGIVYTRTGRRFFNDAQLEADFLARIRAAMDASGFWSQFDTDWACVDCELMPWSAKAQELLRSQYAAVGAAGRAALPKAVAALRQAAERLSSDGDSGPSPYCGSITDLLDRHEDRSEAIGQFVAVYRQYCWPVTSLDDLKLAPFHLLATEGKVHTDQDHVWHMETLAAICRHDPGLLVTTPFQIIDVDDEASERSGTDWWLDLTGQGKVRNLKELDDEVELLRRAFGWDTPVLARQWLNLAVAGTWMFGNAPQEVRTWIVDGEPVAWSFHYLHAVPHPCGFPPAAQDLELIRDLARQVALPFRSRLIAADFVRDRQGGWHFLEAGPGAVAGTAHEAVFKYIARRLAGDRAESVGDAVGGSLWSCGDVSGPSLMTFK